MQTQTEGTQRTPRENRRYPFAVPLTVELPNGLFRRADAVDALIVDLTKQGAALVMARDPRLRERKRYRVQVDDHAGIIEVRYIKSAEDNLVRVGAHFKSLGLELQELVADSVQHAQERLSRLNSPTTAKIDRDPFADFR